MKKKLRVWHIPQIPAKSFIIPVDTEQEASRLLAVLALYDQFQFQNNIKGDYSNAQGVQYFDEDENEWLDYHPLDEDGFEMEFSEYEEEHLNSKDYISSLFKLNEIKF